jgi:prevent-host-death family protein
MEKVINAMKARQNLGTLLNEVSLKNDQFIIERKGKPQAAVIPIWQFEQ